MIRKISFTLLWVAFVGYAFFFAPADQGNTLPLIQQLSTGQWAGINPLIIALFNLMGIWPMIYGSILFADGCSQKIPAWPFAAASFGLGAFALLPYLALREPAPELSGNPDRLLKFWDSRWLAIALSGGAISLLVYGFIQGDWSDFIQQCQINRFIHVMSLDFCMLSLLFPTLIGDDLARRHMDSRWWVISVVPLLGAIAYLMLRSPLPFASPLITESEAN
ncbi:hypothetical protein C1752_03329 [Acaryochloris thomasi RCC1774]|uniref:DUF2834 domain-containing protein n=1 Tax=Acaryochloris thomasi RCC1774 TaxID=1764569 RepID=A0A2W1JS80_9CYAN|nr:DUF2834 domain-containing protein [Acaryochloris thomasi]PZD72824.1 hypothetical protein C1752_03329 [Acaryochloris thomasi RCC1774]